MIFYLSGAGAYCSFLIYKLFNDRECPNTDSASLIAVALASAFWIVVIPISLIEIRSKLKAKSELEDLPRSQYESIPENSGTSGFLA